MNKIATKILQDLKKSKKSNKITIFLGGVCNDLNSWRKDIIKEFKNIFFLDPYDKNWTPEDNIYDELAGMLESDYIVFFRGGKGTKKEKKFLDIIEKKYKEFDNLNELKDFLTKLSIRKKEAYDYSSVQCDLPRDIADEIYNWGLSNIPDSILSDDGREDNIHVTVKYGLHITDPTKVRDYLLKQDPIKATLGKISLFNKKEEDVIKIEVISPQLHELNKVISKNFEITDTYPAYIPHITICYIKKGYESKYSDLTDFEGREIVFNSAVFSGKDNRKTTMSFPKKAKKDRLEEGIMTKIAIITEKIDAIADEIQKQDPKLALELDKISDHIEKKAYYTPMGWIPGRGRNMGQGWTAWNPGRRMGPPPIQRQIFQYICPKCNKKIKQDGGFQFNCPDCQVPMIPDVRVL